MGQIAVVLIAMKILRDHRSTRQILHQQKVKVIIGGEGLPKAEIVAIGDGLKRSKRLPLRSNHNWEIQAQSGQINGAEQPQRGKPRHFRDSLQLLHFFKNLRSL